MPSDNDNITQAYMQILVENMVEEASGLVKTVKRISDTKVEVDGVEKDITNWMVELSDGVDQLGRGNRDIHVWTRRKIDKVDPVTKQVVARKGEPVEFVGRYGIGKYVPKGTGHMGTPKEVYRDYQIVKIYCERDGERQVRNINVPEIFRVKGLGVTYDIV